MLSSAYVNFSTMKTTILVTLLNCLLINVSSYNANNPGKIEMAVGDIKNITCDTGGTDSAKVYFWEKNRNETIRHPDERIFIPSKSSIVLKVSSENQFSFEYQCMDGESAIGRTKVDVGTKPVAIEDFSCLTYDFENMTCNFTEPYNAVFTEYKISYTDTPYTCNNIKHVDGKIHFNLTLPLNENDSCKYLKQYDLYNFSILATNALGRKLQNEIVYQLKNIKPAALQIDVGNETTNSVILYWENKKWREYAEKNITLEYEFCLKPKDLGIYCATDYPKCEYSKCSISRNNLQYPGYEYGLSVRVKLENAKDNFWSEPFNTTFKTKPQRPNRPPITDIGSFYSDLVAKLQLFWKPLEIYEHNGPKFGYIIREIDSNGNVIHSPYVTYNSTLKLEWKRPFHSRTFQIKSINELGESTNSSVIHVPEYRQNNTGSILMEISKDFYSNMYVIAWKPPKFFKELLNYTVFWCTQKPENFNECEDSINFTQIDKNQRNFTIQYNQSRTLTLGVSANYAEYNAGIQWASCTNFENPDLLKLAPEIKSRTSTTIQLRWIPIRICKLIIKSYNLTYCEVDTINLSESFKCLTPIMKIISPGEVLNYTITNLKPYTKYLINMSINLKRGNHGPPSENLFAETLEAAPSEPRDLQLTTQSITSKSVKVSWLAPIDYNGNITHYKIKIIKSNPKGYPDIRNATTTTVHGSQRIHSMIDGLSSYTTYTISVIATTVEDSNESNIVNFTTKIGVPTIPRNIVAIQHESSNTGSITWADPELLSGRLEFYVVAMTIKRDNKTIVKTNILNGHKCNVRFPDCDTKVTFQVRAVNFANKTEIDYQTFPNNTIMTAAAAAASNNEITMLQPDDQLYLECENTVPLDERFQFYNAYKDDSVQHHKNGFSFFSSAWQSSNRDFNFFCENWDRNFITYLVATVFLMLFIVSATFSIVKKYKTMKNIHVVLPPGLVDHLSQTKYNDSAVFNVEHKKEMTGSSDCLIKDKENLRLLAAKRQCSSNAGDHAAAHVDMSLCSHYANDVRNQSLDNYNTSGSDKEDDSNGSLNDEQFSSRTDSVEINDFSSLSQNIPQKDQLTATQKQAEELTNTDELPSNVQHYTNCQALTEAPSNGYITCSPALLNSSNGVGCSNGYIKADSLKQATPFVVNRAVHAMPFKSSDIPIEEPFEMDHNKNTASNNNNHSEHNNNMYVTQAQLAELGRCSQVK